MASSARIQEVAAAAEVGISTVSKVLNGYTDISEKTRKRVLNAVEELSYSPNRMARSFRTGKTQTVSVILPRIGTDFYDRLITSIDDTLADHDYDAALFPLLSERRLQRYKSADALPYHSDGVVMASLNPECLFSDASLPVNLPLVLVDSCHADYDSITLDNAGGAKKATTHLLKKSGATYAILIEGYNKPPFLSGVFLERLKGFRQAREEAELPPDNHYEKISPFTLAGAREVTRQIIRQNGLPVNIFASCDLFARAVLDEVKSQHLIIGKDVRVVGI